MKRKILYLSTIAALLLTGCKKEKVNEAALEHLKQKPTSTIARATPTPTLTPTPLLPIYTGDDAIDKVYPDLYTSEDVYKIRDLIEKYVEVAWNISANSDINQIREILSDCFDNEELIAIEVDSLQKGIDAGDTCDLKNLEFVGAIVYEEEIYASANVTFVVNGNEQKKSYAMPVKKSEGKWYITK